MEVGDRRTEVRTGRGVVRAVDGGSLHVDSGETVGLVGESGSGKTMLALSILGPPPVNASTAPGRVVLGGKGLLRASEAELPSVRGSEVAISFQDPLGAFNPVTKVRRTDP